VRAGHTHNVDIDGTAGVMVNPIFVNGVAKSARRLQQSLNTRSLPPLKTYQGDVAARQNLGYSSRQGRDIVTAPQPIGEEFHELSETRFKHFNVRRGILEEIFNFERHPTDLGEANTSSAASPLMREYFRGRDIEPGLHLITQATALFLALG
jgi:hypothetical protein